MKNNLNKIKIIAWKMLTVRRREYLKTILEIILPLLLYGVIVFVSNIMPVVQIKYVNETQLFQQEPIHSPYVANLFYAPNVSVVNDLMQKVKQSVQPKLFEYFSTEKEMLDRIFVLRNLNIYNVIGVGFDDLNIDEKHIHYRIYTVNDPANLVENLFSSDPPYTRVWAREYILSGFVAIQKYIDFAYIDKVTNNKLSVKNADIQLELMPFPPHKIDNSISADTILPLYIVFSFYMLFNSGFLTPVMHEKTSGTKHIIIAMGLPSWIYWLGWFIYTMSVNLFTITIITMIFTINFTELGPTYFENSNRLIIWIFFFFLYISLLSLILLVTVIFDKSEYAMNVAGLLWFLPYFLLSSFGPIQSETLIVLYMFFPNCCTQFAISTILGFERIGGLHFSNLWSKPNIYHTDPSVGLILFMLLLDSFIHFGFTWYFLNLFPGDFGIPRPWYFPVIKLLRISQNESNEPEKGTLKTSPNVEPVASHLEAGIQIRNIRKKFKNKYAVDGVNLDVYSNQITVLLGHNGAGKTTLMNIIAGLVPATSGIIIVNGFNIKTDLQNVQKSIGVCFQHNIGFSGLTVLEHLIFFSMLRGLPMSEARTESHKFLGLSNMSTKANNIPLTLSGGMRRKLSLGMAIIGKSNVTLLDEPTSGLDPEARKDLRNFLLGMRGERTILITTHHMDEADLLGDRIAIMHHGQLMCYGTPLFLKNYYGAGYTLSVSTQVPDRSAITTAVKSYVSSAFVKSANTGIIVYALPTTNTSSLSNLFTALDKNKSDLRIANFAITVTSMDDVFLKVGEIADFDKDTARPYNILEESNVQLTLKFAPNYLQTFKALFTKLLKYYKHNKFSLIFRLLINVSLFFSMCLFVLVLQTSCNLNIDLKLKMYDQAESFYSSESSMESLANCYNQVVTKQGSKASHTIDVYNSILDVANVDEFKYHRTLITGAQFNNQMKITAMYGHYGLHGPPISLNLITNSLLQWLADDSYSISVSNVPLPPRINIIMVVTMMPVSICIGFSILVVIFVQFLQDERLSGIKHLQIMAGSSRFLYWMSVYSFDILVYLIHVTLILILQFAFLNGKAFGTLYTIANVGLVLLLFGLSYLPFCYLFHFADTKGFITCATNLTMLTFGIISPLVLYIMSALNVDNAIIEYITYVIRVIPNFACAEGLQNILIKSHNIYQWNIQKDSYSNNEHICTFDPDSEECKNMFSFYRGDKNIVTTICYFLGDIFFYWILLFLIDSNIMEHFCNTLCGQLLCSCVKIMDDKDLDSDVVEERNCVNQQIQEYPELSEVRSTFEEEQRMEDILIVSNIHHWFTTTYAVRGLNFGLKKGECFGLLGLNGAGKTTTFKILTGEILATIGTVYFQGISLSKNKTEFLKQIGYCPQFDALNMVLTTREMLQLFGTIRGIQHDQIDSHIEKWLNIFDIKMYENFQCGKLSGGTKRKVCSAVALIGNPVLIMLDEPTSGIDSVSRRNLWNILDVFRKAGHSILLTSQSMDECEALCDRLGIMVDGQLKCIGNIAHLKNKFSQGCIIKIKLTSDVSPEGIEAIKNIIEAKYSCILKDEHFGMLMYHITSPNVTLADVFLFLESLKQKQSMVEDFSASSTSLEDIFLAFAKEKKKL